jgi:hypothetical protein
MAQARSTAVLNVFSRWPKPARRDLATSIIWRAPHSNAGRMGEKAKSSRQSGRSSFRLSLLVALNLASAHDETNGRSMCWLYFRWIGALEISCWRMTARDTGGMDCVLSFFTRAAKVQTQSRKSEILSLQQLLMHPPQHGVGLWSISQRRCVLVLRFVEHW